MQNVCVDGAWRVLQNVLIECEQCGKYVIGVLAVL